MLKISICDKLMLEILKLLRLLKSDYLKRTRIMRRAVVTFGNNFRNFKLKIQMSWLGFFVKIDEYWLTIFAWECPQPEWLEHPVKWLIRSSFIGISWNPTLGGIFFLKLGNSLQLQLIDNFLNCSIPAYWLAWLSIQPVIWFPLFSRCCPFGQIQLQLLYPIRRGPEGSEIPPQSPQGLVGSTTL